MAERNRQTEAVILSVREQGESNRTVCALSPDLGVVYATLYGGPKSRLRSLVQPFNAGMLFLYDDAARHARKVTDFDVSSCHLTLRENLFKMWAAGLAAELVLKTRCGGDDCASYVLLKALLDGMDASSEAGARLGMLRFLWRYLGVLGVRPDTRECAGCGAPLAGGGAAYVPAQSGFACTDCMPPDAAGCFPLGAEALAYLDAVCALPPGRVRAIALHAPAAYEIKRLAYHLVEQAAGCRLRALENGAGIL